MNAKNTQVRRTERVVVLTDRAKQYKERRAGRHGGMQLFPAVGDSIYVKWVVRDKLVWWKATVLSIEQTEASRKDSRSGMISYEQLGEYGEEVTTVTFSASSSLERFITSVSVDGTESETSSWIYSSEYTEDNGNFGEQDGAFSLRTPSIVKAEQLSSSTTPQASSTRSKHESTARARGTTHPSLSAPHRTSPQTLKLRGRHVERLSTSAGTLMKKTRLSGAVRSSRRKLFSTPSASNSHGSNFERNSSPFKTAKSEEENVIEANTSNEDGEERISSHERPSLDRQTGIELRLTLLERQLLRGNTLNESSFSSSAQSVIISLRWSMLRALEKPLKHLSIEGLAEHGLASHEIVVSAQCDYYTFRDISATLAKEHKCTQGIASKSRIAFSPAFSTTQSGSSAANNMNILFSTLADLTTFLRVRDDNDFEAILSKEVVSARSTFLRIVGTFVISEGQAHPLQLGESSSSLTTTSTKSVSVSSDNYSTITLFIGTAPVNVVSETSGKEVSASSEGAFQTAKFRSRVLRQECKHFCSIQKCYTTPWKVEDVETDLSVQCSSDLDGTVPKAELDKHILLNWTRQAAPSSIKWTKDIHDIGNNTPGTIKLCLPLVFFNANRNVNAVISILDKHIETFMKVRSIIHCSSSFK